MEEKPHLFREIALSYQAMIRLATRRLGVSEARINMLRQFHILSSQKQDITPARLARRLRIDPAAVSRLLSELEAEGSVSRLPHPEDKRKLLLTLTTRGRREMLALHQKAKDFETALVCDIDPEELETSLRVLGQVHERLRRLSDEE